MLAPNICVLANASIVILLTLCVNHCYNFPNIIVNLSFKQELKEKRADLFFKTSFGAEAWFFFWSSLNEQGI